MTPEPDRPRQPLDGPAPWGPLAALTALGVLIRLLLLWLSGEPELQSDEANYVYLALMWERFGVYLDQHRFLWPPAYTFYLGAAFEAFGDRGLLAARIGQALASASIGLTTMLFAYRLFGRRAAVTAGLIWVAYLPLAVFSHLLWNETLFLAVFLPGLYQVMRVSQGDVGRVDLRLIMAGVAFAIALLLKESPTYLLPALAGLLWLGPEERLEGFRRASLLLLTTAVILVPWGLRNQEVYGRFVFSGASIGENAYNGLNASYRNFDLIALDTERMRRDQPSITGAARQWFIQAEDGTQWERAEEVPNVVERSDVQVSRGLEYAREHPGWFVRSRLKKLADLATPMSFYTRHMALGHYDQGLLGGNILRKASGIWAMAGPLLILPLGIYGLFALMRWNRQGLVPAMTILYVVGTSLLVAMSRFRTPAEPLLIALAAGVIAGPRIQVPSARKGLALAAVTLLLFAWWINLPEISTVFSEMIWRAES